MNTLIIAENVISDKQAEKLKLVSIKESAQILALDLNSISTFEKNNIEFITSDYLLNNKDRSQISLKSFTFAKLYSNQDNILNYKGICLARALNMTFIFALNSVSEINQIIKNYILTNPDCNRIIFYASKNTFNLCKIVLSEENINFKFYSTQNSLNSAKAILNNFIKSFITLSVKFNKTKNRKILFFENLERVGNIPDLLSKGLKAEIISPKFSFKDFNECKKRGLDYSTLPAPGVFSHLTSLNLIKKQKLFLKKIIADFFNNPNLAEQIFSLLMATEKKELPVLISELNYFSKTIGKFSVSVVSNDTTAQAKLAVLVSQKNNIPTLVIQHGVTTGGETGKKNESRIFGIGFLPLTADKMAVSGPISYEWLASNEVDKNKLLITGLPQFDKYLNCDIETVSKKSKEKICIDLNLNLQKPIILFATQHSNPGSRLVNYHLSPYENYKIIKAIANTILPFKDKFSLIVKLHPASEDTISAYSNVMKKTGLNCIITQYYNTFDLIAGSQIVITPWSTVGAEALLLNKQLVTLNLTERPEIMPYSEYKAAYQARSEEELKFFLNEYLNNNLRVSQSNISNFNKLYNDTNGKTAAINIAESINNMTRCKHAECCKN